MALYATLAEAIHAYSGLSPAAFFTILALMVGAYRLVCGMFVSPDAAPPPPPPPPPPPEKPAEPPALPAEPVQLGEVTLDDLRAYDGSDPGKPLLMAINGQIYDVSRSRMFYGPGGPYSLFAGRDASRALALMSFDSNDLTSNIEGLDEAELEVLQDWEYKFREKYVKVGEVVSEKRKELVAYQSNKKANETEELHSNNTDKDVVTESKGSETEEA